jgi:hypothetical protein
MTGCGGSRPRTARRPAGLLAALAVLALSCTPEAPPDSEPLDPARIAALRVDTSSTTHWTDFLTAGPGCDTLNLPGRPEEYRKRCLEGLVSRGYTHVYLWPINEDTETGPAFDLYDQPNTFLRSLVDAREAGLLPVVWLFSDDAPKLEMERAPALLSRMERLVPVIDPLVDSYVLGLELDEYWEAPLIDLLGTRLDSLTTKRIGVHQTPGRWDLAALPWVDMMILQYGFGLTEQDIREMTARAIRELGKPVVAGEYEYVDEARSKPLGDAAIAAGAAGFGNGGTMPAGGAPAQAAPDSVPVGRP